MGILLVVDVDFVVLLALIFFGLMIILDCFAYLLFC